MRNMQSADPDVGRPGAEEDRSDLVRAFQKLCPFLKTHAQGHEEAGQLHDDVIAALTAAGAFGMAAPARYGGAALSSSLITRLVAELATACPSTAWVTAIVNSAVAAASAMDPHMRQRLFSNGIPLICGTTSGDGSIARERNGWVVSGRWSYASGCRHTDWILVTLNSPDMQRLMVTLPSTDITIERTWDVAGMKGTGSETVVADKVFIEDNQVCEISADGEFAGRTAADRLEAMDYRTGSGLLRLGILAVIVGAAEGLVLEVSRTGTRPTAFSRGIPRTDSGFFRAKLGEAGARIAISREILDAVARFQDSACEARRKLTPEENVRLGAMIAAAAGIVRNAVDDLLDLHGSSAFASSNRAQRLWRDISVASRHALLTPEPNFDAYGRSVLLSE